MRVALLLCLFAAACASPLAQDDEMGGVFELNAAPKRVQHIPYKGGAVLHRAREVHLYWGTYYETAAGRHEVEVLDAFARHAGGTGWFAVTRQYGDADGAPLQVSVEGDSAVVAKDPGPSVTDADLQNFVVAQIEKGTVRWSPESIYFVFTPPGTVTHGGKRGGGTSCKTVCGYHHHAARSIRGVGLVDVLYSNIPHGDCPDGCSVKGISANGPALDQETITLSHELTETITDPALDAWTTGKGENELGDLCNGGSVASWAGRRFAVQDLWSNADRRCVSGK